MRTAAWLAGLVLAGLGSSQALAAAPAPSYTKDIKPFLSNYCLECHQGNKAKAGVTLDTYQALMKGDRRGRSLVIPGKPDNSRLLHTMEGKAKPMPPKKSQQPTAQEIAKVRAWIAAGAKDDSKGVKPVGLEIGFLDANSARVVARPNRAEDSPRLSSAGPLWVRLENSFYIKD